MLRGSLILLLLLSAAPLLQGQMADRTASKDEFPALQLLPPGSKVKGISLPRYQNHRVTAHIIADLMEVRTRRLVTMTAIRTMMYSENGETTVLKLRSADYDFGSSVMTTDKPGSVENPRFSAQGKAVIFNTTTQSGVLKGPVYTTLNTDLLNNPPAAPKK